MNEDLVDTTFESLVKTANQFSGHPVYGDMISVQVKRDPYRSGYVAEASWSSGVQYVGELRYGVWAAFDSLEQLLNDILENRGR